MQPRLSLEQIQGLRNINLSFYFGTHGKMVSNRSGGEFATGLIDNDYKGVADAVLALDPAKGDVLATEGISDDALTPKNVLDKLSKAAFTSGFDTAASKVVSKNPMLLASPKELHDDWFFSPTKNIGAVTNSTRKKACILLSLRRWTSNNKRYSYCKSRYVHPRIHRLA